MFRMIISFWTLLNESCLNKLLFYQLAAKVSMPSVRMHKIMEWLLFIHLADDMCAFQFVGQITSHAFKFDGLTRSWVK